VIVELPLLGHGFGVVVPWEGLDILFDLDDAEVAGGVGDIGDID
jgi:hypothetical protein